MAAIWRLSSATCVILTWPMGEGANNGETKRLYTRVTPQIAEQIEGLAKLGLYGGSASEVIRYFVKNGLREVIRSDEIEKAIKAKATLGKLVEYGAQE